MIISASRDPDLTLTLTLAQTLTPTTCIRFSSRMLRQRFSNVGVSVGIHDAAKTTLESGLLIWCTVVKGELVVTSSVADRYYSSRLCLVYCRALCTIIALLPLLRLDPTWCWINGNDQNSMIQSPFTTYYPHHHLVVLVS